MLFNNLLTSKVTPIFEIVILDTKWKNCKSRKFVHKKFYVHEKILRTRNGHCKFTKNLLPEKRKENM